MITFSVATNFDPLLLEEIAELNETYSHRAKIEEVYGAMSSGVIGSAREQRQLPRVDFDRLKEYVDLAHSLGLKFNYLMNVRLPKDKKQGIDSEVVSKIILETRKLREEMGVDSITIGDDFMLQLGINYISPLYISCIMGIDKTSEVYDVSMDGARRITLNQHTVNRNSILLDDLKRYTKAMASNVELQLYANISCLANCTVRDLHYDYLSGISQFNERKRVTDSDPFIMYCSDVYLNDPTEFLKSPFIRPEDISYYEKEFGITHFKLSDRREPTDALVELYGAYMAGEFHGNLFDLLFRYGRKWTNAVHGCTHAHIGVPKIHIDNDELTRMQFIENVMNLKGEELQAFYGEATKRAVRFE